MRAETRAYFSVDSDTQSPEELTAAIGLVPSSVTRRGSRRSDPPVPRFNSWQVESPLDRSAPLWRHLDALYELVAPAAAGIAGTCRGEPAARLEIVREFFPGSGEADLGFALDGRWLAILQQTGAFADVDEYDRTASDKDDP